jgi:hypothetical protein
MRSFRFVAQTTTLDINEYKWRYFDNLVNDIVDGCL